LPKLKRHNLEATLLHVSALMLKGGDVRLVKEPDISLLKCTFFLMCILYAMYVKEKGIIERQ
jgi:hypothetical protein